MPVLLRRARRGLLTLYGHKQDDRYIGPARDHGRSGHGLPSGHSRSGLPSEWERVNEDDETVSRTGI